MNNYDQVGQLAQVAAESTGSASQRMETYLDSVEAKTNELKATWEEFVTNLNQSESYKQLLDILIWVLNNMPTIIGYVSALVILLKGDTIARSIKSIFTGFGGLSKIFKDFGTNLQILRTGWYRNSEGILTVASSSQTLSASLSVLKVGLSSLIAIITVGLQIYNAWKQANVEAANKAKEEAEGYKAQADAMDNSIQKYKEIYESTDDYNTKQEKLKQLSQDLQTEYGKEANALDLLNGKYDENVAAMEKAANKKRLAERTSLKTASDKGESNLNNWTNHMFDVDYETNTYDVTKENKDALQKIQSIAGGKVKFITNVSKHSEIPVGRSTYAISNLNDLFDSKLFTNGGDIKGLTLSNTATNEEALKVAQNLQEYLDKNIEELDEPIRNMISGFISKIKSEVDKDAEGQYENKQKYQLARATQNDDGSLRQEIKDYESALQKEQQLEEDYAKETNEEKKEQLKERLGEQYKLTEEALSKVKKLYTGGGDQSTLSEKSILDYLGYGEDSTNKTDSNIYTTLDESQIQDYKVLRTEIEQSDVLSEELVQKIKNFRQELKDAGKEKALENFDEEMKNLNVQILEGIEGYKNLKDKYNDYLNDRVTYYEGSPDNIQTRDATDYDKYVDFIEKDLTQMLEMNGVKFSENWYNSLKEQLKKGEISGEEFFNKLSEAAKGFGIDLDEPIKKMEELASQNFDGVLGSQSSFIEKMDDIDELYSDATNIKSGKDLDNDRIVELRNDYEELNKYIAETGDLTFQNGKLLTEIADNSYEDGEKALEGQISALEDYQDAILNTVDAMGIMAEFKEELAKIDSDLAETITDNAIAEAEAKGMYVDVTKAASDGVYQANETLEISEDNLLTQTQAAAQGIFDSKETEMDIATGMAEASIEANNALQDSEYATAEQKVQAAEWAGNAKAAEAEITAGAAETESTAEGSSAQASAEGASAKADSQSIAAQAAITTGQAFLQMAQAIAEAGNKLNELQGQLDTLNADNSSNAQKAAAAYKEAQAKIQEAKARLNQYRGANNANKGAYSKAKPSGSSGGSKGSSYSPEDAASDLKDILQDIEDYESDIELDLQDQTEELINHYNLEKNKLDLIREQLDYYDGIYDVTENTSKWLDTQLKILDEESKKTSEIYESNKKIADQREKIYNENSGYNVRSWFDEVGNETLAYGDLLNSFEYKKEAIQKEIAQRMRAEYNAVANSTDKDTISAAKDRIKQIEEEGDLRIKEIEKEQEKVENIYDSVEQLNDAWKENEEAIRDALTELNDRVKSIRDELVDDLMEQLETAVDKMNKSIEKDVTRLEQLRDVQESYNDILNDTLDTQDELASELQANMDSYEYLDETMRQLMFNEDDYKELNEVLTGIQEDITNIWEDHYNQIQGLSEEEMYKAEYITSETERQLAAKQKEYDLAKAELDVAKAQTNLQNVLNERNQRVFVNGQWQWVADNEAVRDARQQVADAEREKDRLEREQLQQEQLDYLDRIIDSDNLQIDKNNELLEMIQEAIELQTQEVKSIEDALNNIKDTNLPALNDLLTGAVGADGGYLKELLGDINHSQLELAAALRGQSIAQAQNALKTNNLSQTEFQDTLNRLGYSFDQNTGEVVTQDGRFKAHYKGWSAPKKDVQTGTAVNGVQTTGQQAGAGQAAAATHNSNASAGNGKSLRDLAYEVIRGNWGNGAERKRRLTNAGYNYQEVQNLVNAIMWGKAYDLGGMANGVGLLSKATLEPERVLSPRQTKAFENLSKNIVSNPVLNALTRVPSVQSHLDKLNSSSDYSKKYFFSNFTIQANDIEQFINSIETIMPTNK